MSKLRKVLFAVILCSASTAWAQPYGYLSRATVSSAVPEDAPVANASVSALEEAMQNITEELESTSLVPDGLQGQVQRGVLPDIFARNSRPQVAPVPSGQGPLPGQRREQQRGRRASGNSGTRPTTGQVGRTQAGTSGAVSGFVGNAFQFDSNGDGQLAAHEMSNLFLVLTSTLNAERTGQSSGASAGNVGSSGTAGVDHELMRLQSVREAQSLFLQLGMSFDNNADGQLNQSEVRTMGTCLAQNNNSLIDAALQNNPSVVPVLPQSVVPLTGSAPALDEVPQ